MKGLHIFGRDILTTRYSNFELSLSTTCRQSLTFLTLGVDHIHISNITMILSTVSKGRHLPAGSLVPGVTLWSRVPRAFSIVTYKSLSSEVTEVRELSYYGIITQIVFFCAIMS